MKRESESERGRGGRGRKGEPCRDEAESDARGMESPSASDGFELGKVQAAQKRHPSAPTPLSFRLTAPLRDSPCSPSRSGSLFLALSPITPIDAQLAFLRGLSRRPRFTLDCLTLPLYQAHLLRPIAVLQLAIEISVQRRRRRRRHDVEYSSCFSLCNSLKLCKSVSRLSFFILCLMHIKCRSIFICHIYIKHIIWISIVLTCSRRPTLVQRWRTLTILPTSVYLELSLVPL